MEYVNKAELKNEHIYSIIEDSPMQPYMHDCCLVASVASRVTRGIAPGRDWWNVSISCRGKSPHTSPLTMKKASAVPARI